ncbi:hypothetical protein [Paenibacillus sp. USHLN196]
MWQLYISDDNGNMKPFLKPFKTAEDAENMAKVLEIMSYSIKKSK